MRVSGPAHHVLHGVAGERVAGVAAARVEHTVVAVGHLHPDRSSRPAAGVDRQPAAAAQHRLGDDDPLAHGVGRQRREAVAAQRHQTDSPGGAARVARLVMVQPLVGPGQEPVVVVVEAALVEPVLVADVDRLAEQRRHPGVPVAGAARCQERLPPRRRAPAQAVAALHELYLDRVVHLAEQPHRAQVLVTDAELRQAVVPLVQAILVIVGHRDQQRLAPVHEVVAAALPHPPLVLGQGLVRLIRVQKAVRPVGMAQVRGAGETADVGADVDHELARVLVVPEDVDVAGAAAAAAEGRHVRIDRPVDAVRRVHARGDAATRRALVPDMAEHAAETLLGPRRVRVAHHGHGVRVAEVAAAQHDVGAPAVDRAHVQLRLLPVHAVGALRVEQRRSHGEVGRRSVAGGFALPGIAFLVLVPALEQAVVRVADQGGGAVVGGP